MPRDDRDGATSLNKIFLGEVSSVQTYGAFVSIPGASNQGLVHKSQISSAPVPDATEVISRGDRVWCKIIGINDEGKISLSMKVVNQGSGKDLDPNGVIIQQDETRRKSWTPQNRRQTIVLDAVFNTKCAKCGTSGHLSKDCFQIPGGKTYELLPEIEASKSRNEATAEEIIENADSKIQDKIKKKLKKERKKMKKQKKKARKLKKMKKKKSKKQKKHKASSSSTSSSSSSSSSSESDNEKDSDHKARGKPDKHSAEKSSNQRLETKRNPSPQDVVGDGGPPASSERERQYFREKPRRRSPSERPERSGDARQSKRTGWSSSPESPHRRRRSTSPEEKRRRL